MGKFGQMGAVDSLLPMRVSGSQMEPFMSVIQIQNNLVAPNMVGVEVMLTIVLVRLVLIIGQEIKNSQQLKEFQTKLIK